MPVDGTDLQTLLVPLQQQRLLDKYGVLFLVWYILLAIPLSNNNPQNERAPFQTCIVLAMAVIVLVMAWGKWPQDDARYYFYRNFSVVAGKLIAAWTVSFTAGVSTAQ